MKRYLVYPPGFNAAPIIVMAEEVRTQGDLVSFSRYLVPGNASGQKEAIACFNWRNIGGYRIAEEEGEIQQLHGSAGDGI
jgi:hypothetical protein